MAKAPVLIKMLHYCKAYNVLRLKMKYTQKTFLSVFINIIDYYVIVYKQIKDHNIHCLSLIFKLFKAGDLLFFQNDKSTQYRQQYTLIDYVHNMFYYSDFVTDKLYRDL